MEAIMFSVVKSFSAAERLDLASQFVRSFPAGTEFLLIGASRNAVGDFVRALARMKDRRSTNTRLALHSRRKMPMAFKTASRLES
jgi:hypothetical protein